MYSSIAPLTRQRKTLLHLYRHHNDPELRHRAHILLLLADGYTWQTIAAVLYTSTSTIARWQQRCHDSGLVALAGHKPGRRPFFCCYWIGIVARWLTEQTPRDFGFLRSRWTCALVVVLLWRYYQLASAVKPSAAGCITPIWSGVGRVRSSTGPIRLPPPPAGHPAESPAGNYADRLCASGKLRLPSADNLGWSRGWKKQSRFRFRMAGGSARSLGQTD